ncbi:MAG: hypothetical protein GEU93_05675 [Propionibacteriales bacterium]|nr:hypothetical protein [Propionibacteriales bacterium]
MRLAAPLRLGPQPPRRGGRRDRHDRGVRGALSLPGPLTPLGVDYPLGPAQRFDDLVLAVAHEATERHPELEGVEFGVEEAPLLPEDWSLTEVPLATVVRSSGRAPDRIVLFRRPLEHRAAEPAELSALVFAVVVEQVAELLEMDPYDVDPRYGG